MKNTILFTLFVLAACQTKQVQKNTKEKSTNEKDCLFTINVLSNENMVSIIPPNNFDFKLHDDSAKTKSFQTKDFNANGKEDILVNLGDCGSGGCMYGLFLNQYDNLYTLVFMDYLKNIELKKEDNGLWTIKSSEEFAPYDPSKILITIFKFDRNNYQYTIDTTFTYYDKEAEQMMNEED